MVWNSLSKVSKSRGFLIMFVSLRDFVNNLTQRMRCFYWTVILAAWLTLSISIKALSINILVMRLWLYLICRLSWKNHQSKRLKLPNINIGIGINTAQVIAGKMGSLHRSNYSVIGDGISIASQLENLTKYFGVSIIVSEGL